MERLLLECAIRSTLIIAAAAVVVFVMRIKNAEARHSTWTGVLLFSLALPLLVASGYTVPLRILPPMLQNAEQVAPYATSTTPFILSLTHPTLDEPSRIDAKREILVWPEWIEGIYIFGVAVLLIRLVTGMIGAYRIRRQARLVDGRLTNAACSCPITVGVPARRHHPSGGLSGLGTSETRCRPDSREPPRAPAWSAGSMAGAAQRGDILVLSPGLVARTSAYHIVRRGVRHRCS